MRLLSYEAEELFQYLQRKIKNSTGFIAVCSNDKILKQFPEYVDMLYELKEKNFISGLEIWISGGFKCRLKNYEFNSYMKGKINMVGSIDSFLEKFLKNLINNEQNLNSYIQDLYNNSNDIERSELNEMFGELRDYGLISCLFADNIVVECHLRREGRHYFELKNSNDSLKNKAKVINNYNAPVNNVTGNNAQINTATDYASINTIQNNNNAELDSIIDDIKKNVATLDDNETQDAIVDNVENIHTELVSAKPNMKLVSTLLKGLNCIVKNPKLAIVAKGVEKLEQFINKLGEITNGTN